MVPHLSFGRRCHLDGRHGPRPDPDRPDRRPHRSGGGHRQGGCGRARLYIDSVNAKGGIRGEKIELVTLDDKFDPKIAAANASTLITEKNVVALFLNRGTPHTEAIMPLLEKHGVALVAPSTGAMLLHSPVNRYIFNVRSSYQREAAKAVAHLHTLGIDRIAVVHVDDSFGTDALEGANKGFAKANLKPVAVVKADRNKPDYPAIVPALAKATPQAILWFGSGTAVADGIKALRAAGSAAQVVTLSNNASAGFIKALGDASRGVIVTQVFPYEKSFSYGIVKEALELAKAKGQTEISPAILEGYAAAKVSGRSAAASVTEPDAAENADCTGKPAEI
jgi:branched-chain amino acid transport system substrate-binding protein